MSGYFSVSDARMISAGMAAAVTPSTVHAERDGSIYGIVSSVSTDFETKDSLMRFYRNAAFADFIFSRCNMVPVKVNILLSRNMKSPSGFNWTSGKGPDIRIPSGTMCSVRVVTRQSTPLEIFLGKCNRFMTGNGLIESKKGFRSYSATQEQ